MSTPWPEREDLVTEFKSDTKRLSDSELVEAVVCLANTEGGTIYLGVEDDGTTSGLHATRDLTGCEAMIANRTSPGVRVEVRVVDAGALRVACISVPKGRGLVSTTDGVMKRRQLDAHGEPQCVPLLPSDIPTRLSDLRAMDASAQPVPSATLDDLDPVERDRLRQFIERYRGDVSLLKLTDEELDGALELTTQADSTRVPTLTGLLLVGRDASLRRLVRTHEVAFQVLEGEEVRFNEFRRDPLLRLVEWMESQFTARNPEEELQVGLFRVGVPRVDLSAYREAVANALVHRDYTRVGAVHVKLDSEALTVSNPGGFVEGVTSQNILTTPPRPRNPTLADAFKRIGLVERTGRGVDLIYRSTLRYGRPAPSYAQSDRAGVTLRIPAAEADRAFIRMVVEAEKARQTGLPINSLIALACLSEQRQVTAEELAVGMQTERPTAKRTLEALVEAGLVEPRGRGRARHYMLSARVYSQLGDTAAHTRQKGIDAARNEHMLLQHVAEHGPIARAAVMSLCQLTGDQASYLLRGLVEQGKLVTSGSKRWTRYSIPARSDD